MFLVTFFPFANKYIKVMKYILDLNVVAVEHLHERYVLISSDAREAFAADVARTVC